MSEKLFMAWISCASNLSVHGTPFPTNPLPATLPSWPSTYGGLVWALFGTAWLLFDHIWLFWLLFGTFLMATASALSSAVTFTTVPLILWFEFWVERENSVVRDDRKSFEVGSQKGDYEVCSFLHSCYCLLCDYEFSRFVCCFWILEFSVWAECWGILFLYVREKEGVWFCSNWELYGILFVIVIFMELCKQFYE